MSPRQWRSGERLSSPAKSGFGLPSKTHSDLNHDSSIRRQLPVNFHTLSEIPIHCHFAYSKFQYLKACSFASFIHTSLLGFGWKRVVVNSGPKNPKDMLKKRRVSPSQLVLVKASESKQQLTKWKSTESLKKQEFNASMQPKKS
ncbi:hypothetical protein TNCV_3407241 [Trichonephila clavipes]|nr:hypothetical protein TNCV_3407241 [Trichonephila clavipes]